MIMRYYIYHNPENTRKQELQQEILTRLSEVVTDPTQAELIIVLGGDGSMIRAVQELKQYNIPFFGVNCGTL
jgi:NAD+ kinase